MLSNFAKKNVCLKKKQSKFCLTASGYHALGKVSTGRLRETRVPTCQLQWKGLSVYSIQSPWPVPLIILSSGNSSHQNLRSNDVLNPRSISVIWQTYYLSLCEHWLISVLRLNRPHCPGYPPPPRTQIPPTWNANWERRLAAARGCGKKCSILDDHDQPDCRRSICDSPGALLPPTRPNIIHIEMLPTTLFVLQ
jgi:hypothetical protein